MQTEGEGEASSGVGKRSGTGQNGSEDGRGGSETDDNDNDNDNDSDSDSDNDSDSDDDRDDDNDNDNDNDSVNDDSSRSLLRIGAPLLLAAGLVGCASPIPARVEARPAVVAPVAASASSSAPVAVEPPDADHDGVPDTRDVCPREPGADDANPAWAGCPYDASPRPTPHLFEDLELLLGNTPRALDAKETEMLSGLGAMMKDEPTLTLLASAPTKAVAEGWLRIVEKQLIAGGVAKEKLVQRSCVHPIRLVRTTVARGEKTCADLRPEPAAR